MRWEINGKALTLITLTAFLVLLSGIMYGLYHFRNAGSGFESVVGALDGVAAIAGAIVAILLAVIAIRVSSLAETSQSPEYQAAFQSYQAVWEIDALISALEVGKYDVKRLPIIKSKVLDVAFRPELMMLLTAAETHTQKGGIDTKLRLRDIASEAHEEGNYEVFNTAVAGLRDSAIDALEVLRSDPKNARRGSYLRYVALVTAELGTPTQKHTGAHESKIEDAESGLSPLLTPLASKLAKALQERGVADFSLTLGKAQRLPLGQLGALVDHIRDEAGVEFDVEYIFDADDKASPDRWMLPGRRTLVLLADPNRNIGVPGRALLLEHEGTIKNNYWSMVRSYEMNLKILGRQDIDHLADLAVFGPAEQDLRAVAVQEGHTDNRGQALAEKAWDYMCKSVEDRDFTVVYLGFFRDLGPDLKDGELLRVRESTIDTRRHQANESRWEDEAAAEGLVTRPSEGWERWNEGRRRPV